MLANGESVQTNHLIPEQRDHLFRKIVVEGDGSQHIGSTPVLDYLELVTEGRASSSSTA